MRANEVRSLKKINVCTESAPVHVCACVQQLAIDETADKAAATAVMRTCIITAERRQCRILVTDDVINQIPELEVVASQRGADQTATHRKMFQCQNSIRDMQVFPWVKLCRRYYTPPPTLAPIIEREFEYYEY